MQPSEEAGEGIEEGIIVSPVQVRAYSDAEQASLQASVTTCPSGPRIVPSCALTEPPLGTSQMLKVGLAEQPEVLASPFEVTLAGQLHAPASTMLVLAASASVGEFPVFDPHPAKESSTAAVNAARIGPSAERIIRQSYRRMRTSVGRDRI